VNFTVQSITPTTEEAAMHRLENKKLWDKLEELPLHLLVEHINRRGKNKYKLFYQLEEEYPCIKNLHLVDRYYRRKSDSELKLFRSKVTRRINAVIVKMTPKKPPTPTTPQDRLLALMTSGQITPQQYIRINEIDSQRHCQSERTKRKELTESTKKAGISTVRKIITYDDSPVSPGSSDEEDKENSKKNGKRKHDSNSVEQNLFQGDDDDDDKKPAAKPAPESSNKRRRTTRHAHSTSFGASTRTGFGASTGTASTGFGSTAPAPSAGGHFGSAPAPAPAARNRVVSGFEQHSVNVMKIESGGKLVKSNCVVAVDIHEVLLVFDAEDAMNNNLHLKKEFVLNNRNSFKFKKPENGLYQVEMEGRFDSAVETFTLTMDLNNYERLKMLLYNII